MYISHSIVPFHRSLARTAAMCQRQRKCISHRVSTTTTTTTTAAVAGAKLSSNCRGKQRARARASTKSLNCKFWCCCLMVVRVAQHDDNVFKFDLKAALSSARGRPIHHRAALFVCLSGRFGALVVQNRVACKRLFDSIVVVVVVDAAVHEFIETSAGAHGTAIGSFAASMKRAPSICRSAQRARDLGALARSHVVRKVAKRSSSAGWQNSAHLLPGRAWRRLQHAHSSSSSGRKSQRATPN